VQTTYTYTHSLHAALPILAMMPLRVIAINSPLAFLTVETVINFTNPFDLASCLDCSLEPVAVPPTWKVRIVSWVPGSPMDCAEKIGRAPVCNQVTWQFRLP